MDHPRAQLIANIAERGLYAAATAGAGYLAHQTTGPLWRDTKRAKMEPANDNAQDGFLCNSLGVGCSSAAPTARSGASGGAAGASAPSGSIVQNCIGPPTAGNEYRKFRMTGTLFLTDGSKANTWANIPWEFPRFWLRNRGLWACASNFQYFRTKRVSMAFKNPHQQYNTINGTQVVSGFDHSAKFYVFEDVGRHLGTPLFVKISSADWLLLQQSMQTGAFGTLTNTAKMWPITADMTSGNLNTYVADQFVCDGAPGVEQMACNVGSSTMRSYSPTNDEWRSCSELNIEIGATCQDATWSDTTAAQPSAGNIVDNGYILPFRADNCGCKLIHNGLSMWSPRYLWTYDCTPFLYYTKIPTASTTFPGDSYVYERVNGRYDNGTAQGTCMPYLPEVIERHPQPQLWLNFQNLLAADNASPQQQVFQVQFEYEWEIELSGRYIAFRGADTTSVVKNTKGTMRINNGYDGHNVLAPTRYYAHPFYSCAYNTQGDGTTDTPLTTQKNAVNLLNWRYVQKDDN